MIYNLAEVFHSIQGEGRYAGTPMMFVRFAGCPVGKYAQIGAHESGFSICTSISGEEFTCDTNYHKRMSLSEQQIVAQLRGEKHVCLTGGEPFVWNLEPLLNAFLEVGDPDIHFETSGTLDIPSVITKDQGARYWVTCCPKKGYLPANTPYVDEWKFLVGKDTKLSSIEDFIAKNNLQDCGSIYIQPINEISTISKANLQRCLEILSIHPEWNLSCQLHKLLELR